MRFRCAFHLRLGTVPFRRICNLKIPMPVTRHPRIALALAAANQFANLIAALTAALRADHLLAVAALQECRQLAAKGTRQLDLALELDGALACLALVRVVGDASLRGLPGAAGLAALGACGVGALRAAQVAVHPIAAGVGVCWEHGGAGTGKGVGDGAQVAFLFLAVFD